MKHACEPFWYTLRPSPVSLWRAQVCVAGESTLARHPVCARQAEQQAAASVAVTVSITLVVLNPVSATVSQPLPSEAGADKLHCAADSGPLNRMLGLELTTASSLRPLVAADVPPTRTKARTTRTAAG